MKSEKEKMLAGEYYNAADPELINRWHTAKKLMKEFNQVETTDYQLIDSILSELLGSKGENVWISAPFFVDYGENIHIGNNCEINMDCTFLDCNKIIIGNNCGIGPNVQIYAVTHPVHPEERLSSDNGLFSFWNSYTAPVTIGNNVWIGGGSIILPGITIGDNTTIGAGSVVSKSIPSNCLAVGNPCKVIKSFRSL